MPIYRVLFKKYSEMQKGFVLVEDNIEAADMHVNECGCLTFLSEEGCLTHAFPPGAWFLVDPAIVASESAPPAPGNSLLVYP